MTAAVRFDVRGAREIEQALRQFGVQAGNRMMRNAVNRGATALVKRARELASTPGAADDPYATGKLKRAITKRLRRHRRGSDKQAILGTARGPLQRSPPAAVCMEAPGPKEVVMTEVRCTGE